SQLGARVQHALRAFTPDDQKALSKTVRTYPKTDVYDLESALTSLGIGEAIVTVLSEEGAPTPRPDDRPGIVREVVESSTVRSIMRSAATAAGREITRSIFGTGRRR